MPRTKVEFVVEGKPVENDRESNSKTTSRCAGDAGWERRAAKIRTETNRRSTRFMMEERTDLETRLDNLELTTGSLSKDQVVGRCQASPLRKR
jgi:hypothetical protein